MFSFQNGSAHASGKPPPVNRASKPGVPVKAGALQSKSVTSIPEHGSSDRQVSPFSTPPGSSENSPQSEGAPPVPNGSKPQPKQPSYVSSDVAAELSSSPEAFHSQRLLPKTAPEPPKPRGSNRSRKLNESSAFESKEDTEIRPALPLRYDSLETGKNLRGPASPVRGARSSFDVPRSSALSQGFSRDSLPLRKSSHPIIGSLPREPQSLHPREESSTLSPRPSFEIPHASNISLEYDRNQGDPIKKTSLDVSNAPHVTEFPDSSQSNRRLPSFRNGPHTLPTGYDTRLIDIYGDLICTTGTLTRVWSISNGKLLLSMATAETVRYTAVAFKPARKVEDGGFHIWLGSNIGELQEVDIETKRVVAVNSGAHARREVVRMHRHGAEIWSVDDEGKLYVWPPDSNGSPNLESEVHNGRILRGHTVSIPVGENLWVATGKDIRVFRPSADPTHTAVPMTRQSVSRPGVAEVTTCTLIPNDPNVVYFGHSDGKVTAYSRTEFTCIGTFNVSLYKINCLVGVGDCLWAGFNTGAITVYDVHTRPWRLKKNWLGHANPVINMTADHSSIWRSDKCPVVSLGIDNNINVWDGMLGDDWLGKSHKTVR